MNRFILISVLTLFLKLTYAQPVTDFEIIDPNIFNLEHEILMPNGEKPLHVSNGSLQLSSIYNKNILNAVVYNDLSGNIYLTIILLDTNSNEIIRVNSDFPIKGYFSDVIIRDDLTNLGHSWIISSIITSHNCPNSEINLIEFKLDNLSSPNLNLINNINLGIGMYGKIDGFIDHTLRINNEYWAMRDFAITYNNLDPDANILICHYDENSILLSCEVLPNFLGFSPDIACLTNAMNNGERYVYVVDMNYNQKPGFGTSSNLVLYNFTSNTVVSHEASFHASYIPFLRIDAHTYIDDFLHANRYIVGGIHDCNDHYYLNDYYSTIFTVPSTYLTMNPYYYGTSTVYLRPNSSSHVAAGLGYLFTNNPGFIENPLSINQFQFTSLNPYINPSNNETSLLMTTYYNYNYSYGNMFIPDFYKVNNSASSFGSAYDSYSSNRRICNTCSNLEPIICGHMDYSYYFNSSIATQPNHGDFTIVVWVDEGLTGSIPSIKLKQTNNYSNMGTSIIKGSDSIENNYIKNTMFEIFPNPAKNIVNIRSKNNIDKIILRNTLSQVVAEFSNINSSEYKIQLESFNLNEGLYICDIYYNNEKVSYKVFVE